MSIHNNFIVMYENRAPFVISHFFFAVIGGPSCWCLHRRIQAGVFTFRVITELSTTFEDACAGNGDEVLCFGRGMQLAESRILRGNS